jgi:hypothetical protein
MKQKRQPASPLRPGQPIYLVLRKSWATGCDAFWEHEEAFYGQAGVTGVPVRAFTDESKAQQFLKECEQEARRDLCPIHFVRGDLDEVVKGGGAKRFTKKLLELKVPLPSAKVLKEDIYGPSWQKWWDKVTGELTPEQREAIWNLLEPEPIYRIVAINADGAD